MNLNFLFGLLFPLCICWASPFPVPYKNSFEKTSDVSFDANRPQGDAFFEITRVAAKHGTPNKATHGKYYGTVPLSGGTNIFTRYGGYNRVAFPRYGYSTSIDIYLDKSKIIPPVSGIVQLIEYSSAISSTPPADTDGHRRDFVFHVGATSDGNFIVTCDNNAGFGTGFPPNNDPTPIPQSGWYTFQHDFQATADGILEVIMTVSTAGDRTGTPIGTWTRSDTSDVIRDVVGGNRYGWFTYNGIVNLPIDNVTRSGGAIVQFQSECTSEGWKTVFKKHYKPFSSEEECTHYANKKKLRN